MGAETLPLSCPVVVWPGLCPFPDSFPWRLRALLAETPAGLVRGCAWRHRLDPLCCALYYAVETQPACLIWIGMAPGDAGSGVECALDGEQCVQRALPLPAFSRLLLAGGLGVEGFVGDGSQPRHALAETAPGVGRHPPGALRIEDYHAESRLARRREALHAHAGGCAEL